MKDFIKKYHQQKVWTNVSVVIGAFALALGLQFLFFSDNKDLGKHLTASVLDSKTIKQKSDIFLEKKKDVITIKNSKTMNGVQNLSLSFVYNPDNINILHINSQLGEIQTLVEQAPGVTTIILPVQKENISPNDELLRFAIEKKDDITESLNIINANFSDGTDTYELSTSGLTL